jgi:broad specificity phosphatase PhoE
MFLALHGQTEWNRDGRVQGHSDSPLTEYGRHQAVTVAHTLRSHNVGPDTHAIVCSPIGRTRETARIIGQELGFDISTIRSDERLKEVSLGLWEGRTHTEAQASWPDRISGSNRYDWYFRSPDGESYHDVSGRLRAWLDVYAEQDKLIVVTHGIASRVLRGLYVGLAPEDALQLEVARDAVFQLSDGRVARLGSATQVASAAKRG